MGFNFCTADFLTPNQNTDINCHERHIGDWEILTNPMSDFNFQTQSCARFSKFIFRWTWFWIFVYYELWTQWTRMRWWSWLLHYFIIHIFVDVIITFFCLSNFWIDCCNKFIIFLIDTKLLVIFTFTLNLNDLKYWQMLKKQEYFIFSYVSMAERWLTGNKKLEDKKYDVTYIEI